MKIVIVGTSNSVIGEKGFVQALRGEHEVIQLSSGRTPFFCSLKTIINNKMLIESCDLLILDHYVNDVNFYSAAFNQDYEFLCECFYQYLSSLNVNILNILFPIKDLKYRKQPLFNKFFYTFIKELTEKHSISCLDLNLYEFSAHHFKDRLHLNVDSSYGVGLILSIYLNMLKLVPSKGGACLKSPYSLVCCTDFGNEVQLYENSLMKVTYSDVNASFTLHRKKMDKLISIGYLRPKGVVGLSGLTVNNKHTFGLTGEGYFHETVDFDCFGDVHVSPIFGHFNLLNLMGRGRSDGEYKYSYLTEFLFFNSEINMEFTPAIRTFVNVQLPNLLDVVERLSPNLEGDYKLPKLKQESVNKLRDVAISLENKDLSISRDFMELAHISRRPQGLFIKKKLDEYKARLKELELDEMLKSGEVAIIPAGFRCYTKKNIFEKLKFKQPSLPFDSGFFPPVSVANILERKKIKLIHPDKQAISQTVCIKYENYQEDMKLGKGIKFETSSYSEINLLATHKNIKNINHYLDSTYGYYTLDVTNKFVLAHYNWHIFASVDKSQGEYDTKVNINKINIMMNKRIDRMFDICNKAKHIFFIVGEFQGYDYMAIDGDVFLLNDFEKLNTVANQVFNNKCTVTSMSNVDTAEKLLKIVKS